LLEQNLYFSVEANLPPYFEEEIQTRFTLEVDEFFEYKLPEVTDPDQTRDPILGVDYTIVIEETKGLNARYQYPEFLDLYSDEFTLDPNDDSYAGNTY
jgi:hypothetical protein